VRGRLRSARLSSLSFGSFSRMLSRQHDTTMIWCWRGSPAAEESSFEARYQERPMDVAVYRAGIFGRGGFLFLPDWHQCERGDFLSSVPTHIQWFYTARPSVLSKNVGDWDAERGLSLNRWMGNHFSGTTDEKNFYQTTQWVGAAPAAGDDMKRMIRFVAVLAVMLALGAVAEAQLPHTVPPGTHDTNGFVKGTRLLDRCQLETVVSRTFCLGYIVGVADAIGLTQAMQHENTTGTPVWQQTAVCFPQNVQGTQVRDIVVKFLIEYPERRDDPAAELVLVALVKAWGCPAK
jgi:hypothetical protein